MEGWPWPLYSKVKFVWGKCWNVIFSKCIKDLCWNLPCMIREVKLVSYKQNFVLWGLSALALGLYTCIKLCNILMSSSLKLLEQFSPDFTWAFCWKGILTMCSNGSMPLNEMAAMPLYGEKTKKSSSPEPRKLWGWILETVSGTQGLSSLFKWWWKVDIFIARSNFSSCMHLYGEIKCWNVVFSKCIKD